MPILMCSPLVPSFMPDNLTLGRSHDVIHSEPEFLQQLFERSRRPEGFYPDVVALCSRVLGPAEVRSFFYGYPGLHVRRQNRVPVFAILIREQFRSEERSV